MVTPSQDKLIRRRLAGAYASTIISISLVLLLVALASLLLVNSGNMSDYFKENVRISILFRSDVSDEDASAYAESLLSEQYVKSVSFISKEQGTREMEEMLGSDFLSVFPDSPIPASADVTFRGNYVESDSLEMARSRLLESDLVGEVTYQQSLVDALNRNLGRITMWISLFVALLLFISYALINNTVRLNVYSRRFTVHTMKLVGATGAFIRRPFMVQGLTQGLISSSIAILTLGGACFFLGRKFPGLSEIFSPAVILCTSGIVLLSGVTICLASTYFVVNKLVSLDKDELYC